MDDQLFSVVGDLCSYHSWKLNLLVSPTFVSVSPSTVGTVSLSISVDNCHSQKAHSSSVRVYTVRTETKSRWIESVFKNNLKGVAH